MLEQRDDRTRDGFMLQVYCLAPILLTGSVAWPRLGLAQTLEAAPEVITLTEPRHGHRVHCFDDEIIVLGGFAHRAAADRGTRDVSRFAFGDATWTPLPAMNHGHAFFGSVVIGDEIVALGETVESFDRTKPTRPWTIVALDTSLPRSHFGSAVVDDLIYVVGGFPVERSGVIAIDLSNRSATRVDPYPGYVPGDHFHIVAELNGALHVIGGLHGDSFEPMSTHWIYDDQQWTRAADTPAPMWTKFAVVQVVENAVFAFLDDEGWRYDAAAATWTEVSPMPAMLAMPASFHRNGIIHVLGGQHVRGSEEAFVYDVASDRWRTAEPESDTEP